MGRTDRWLPRRSYPERTCIGCRRRAAKGCLLRMVLTAGDGRENNAAASIVPDPEGHAPGRGAYLHPTQQCLELAERRRALARALRAAGPVDPGPLRAYVERTASEPSTSDTSETRSDMNDTGSGSSGS